MARVGIEDGRAGPDGPVIGVETIKKLMAGHDGERGHSGLAKIDALRVKLRQPPRIGGPELLDVGLEHQSPWLRRDGRVGRREARRNGLSHFPPPAMFPAIRLAVRTSDQ